eukprot:3062513-Rhodomonas_salina.1
MRNAKSTENRTLLGEPHPRARGARLSQHRTRFKSTIRAKVNRISHYTPVKSQQYRRNRAVRARARAGVLNIAH